MSAKVFKKAATDSFESFRFPEISQGKSFGNESGNFVFPQVDEFNSSHVGYSEENFDEAVEETETTIDFTANEIIKSAQEKAAELVARAEEDCRMLEEAAREKALQEAMATFESEIVRRVAEEVAEIRENMAETIAEIASLRAAIFEQAENDLVRLAMEIAKKIIRREATIDREIALTLVKISLAKLHNRTFAEVHLHPEDFAYIQSNRERLDFHGSLEFIEDNSLSPGDCLIHTETGDIDARIESQFEEIAYGLLGK